MNALAAAILIATSPAQVQSCKLLAEVSAGHMLPGGDVRALETKAREIVGADTLYITHRGLGGLFGGESKALVYHCGQLDD